MHMLDNKVLGYKVLYHTPTDIMHKGKQAYPFDKAIFTFVESCIYLI